MVFAKGVWGHQYPGRQQFKAGRYLGNTLRPFYTCYGVRDHPSPLTTHYKPPYMHNQATMHDSQEDRDLAAAQAQRDYEDRDTCLDDEFVDDMVRTYSQPVQFNSPTHLPTYLPTNLPTYLRR